MGEQPSDLSDFFTSSDPHRLNIPRRQVVAVQLCPWKFTLQNTTTWAVQALLVMRNEHGDYVRLPLMLTQDFVGAAQLADRLAELLAVPYLFGADAAGCNAEATRAQNRPALHGGGIAT